MREPQKVRRNHFIEAVAVTIITSCVLPMLVLLLFFWMVKIVLEDRKSVV